MKEKLLIEFIYLTATFSRRKETVFSKLINEEFFYNEINEGSLQIKNIFIDVLVQFEMEFLLEKLVSKLLSDANQAKTFFDCTALLLHEKIVINESNLLNFKVYLLTYEKQYKQSIEIIIFIEKNIEKAIVYIENLEIEQPEKNILFESLQEIIKNQDFITDIQKYYYISLFKEQVSFCLILINFQRTLKTF